MKKDPISHHLARCGMLLGIALAAAATGCGHQTTAPIHDEVDFSDAANLYSQPIAVSEPPAYDPAKVMALVDGRPLPRATFQQEVRLRILNLRQQGASPEQIEQNMPEITQGALRDLVAQMLLLDAAMKEDIQVPADQIDSQIERMKAGLPEGAVWEDFLARQNIPEEALRSRIETKLRVETLVTSRLVDIQAPTPDEIAAFYEENRDRFVEPPKATFRHLLLKVEPDADEEAWSETLAKAAELRALTERDDTPLEKLAGQYSEDENTRENGGLMENVPWTALHPAIASVAFSNEIGVVSEPVRSAAGVHLVATESRLPQRELPLDEVSDFIGQQLKAIADQQAIQPYIQSLLESSNIEYLEPPGDEPDADVEP